jgi:hypothetical protein
LAASGSVALPRCRVTASSPVVAVARLTASGTAIAASGALGQWQCHSGSCASGASNYSGWVSGPTFVVILTPLPYEARGLSATRSQAASWSLCRSASAAKLKPANGCHDYSYRGVSMKAPQSACSATTGTEKWHPSCGIMAVGRSGHWHCGSGDAKLYPASSRGAPHNCGCCPQAYTLLPLPLPPALPPPENLIEYEGSPCGHLLF